MKNWKITVLALFGSVIALAACGQAQTETQKAADARPETQTAAQTGGTAAAENTGYLYIASEVPDPTTCCVPGIEFELDGAVYPDDYPQAGDLVTVAGVFDTYKEGDNTYCTLREARLWNNVSDSL